MFCLNETASENISYIDKESRHLLLSIFVLLPSATLKYVYCKEQQKRRVT